MVFDKQVLDYYKTHLMATARGCAVALRAPVNEVLAAGYRMRAVPDYNGPVGTGAAQ